MTKPRNKWCFSCKDAIETFRVKEKEFDPSPHCRDCWLEKNKGKIPNVTGAKPGLRQPLLEDTGPWQDNAIKDMET